MAARAFMEQVRTVILQRRVRETQPLGDVLGVQVRAAQLEQREVRWRGFAQRVAQLAGQFELEQILALLARYLPPDPQV